MRIVSLSRLRMANIGHRTLVNPRRRLTSTTLIGRETGCVQFQSVVEKQDEVKWCRPTPAGQLSSSVRLILPATDV